MTTQRKAVCYPCNGIREVSASNLCTGCGSRVPRNAPIKIERPQRCPKCTDGVLQVETISQQSRCRGCGYASGQRLQPMSTMKGAR